MKLKIPHWAACGIAAAFLFCTLPIQSLAAEGETPEGQAPVSFTLNSGMHTKYMDGGSDGLFHPNETLSRAELAQMLYTAVIERPETGTVFSDVRADAWYAPAVGAMAGLGIFEGYEDGLFRPEQPVTRGESAQALAALIPAGGEGKSFPDVYGNHKNRAAISAVGGYGLFVGDQNGNFDPDASLSRAEACVVFNKLMGRAPDMAALQADPDLRYFPDLTPNHWAYGQIMEAVVSHTHTVEEGRERWLSATPEPTVLPDGFYRINGWLYCVQNGFFLRSTTYDCFTFDAQGRYTTGDAALDRRLNDLVERLTTPAMTRDEQLRVLYNYVRDNFTYLKRNLIAKGQPGWEPGYAASFLEMGKGNCYSYSALFCLLSREIGQPARTAVGTWGKNNIPHGWVEIVLDGTNYMFDTQVEWRQLHDKGKSPNLFKFKMEDAPYHYQK